MGALELLLQANQRGPRPSGSGGRARVCVVTCDDASLTGRIEAALGIGPGEAVVIRLPGGGTGLPLEAVQKSVAKAVYLDDCDEVVLLSHGNCSLSSVTANQVIDALATWDVPRHKVPFDVRDLVAASREPKAALRELADSLRRAEFLPAELLVHLCHLEEDGWSVQVVEHGQNNQLKRAEDPAAHISGYQQGPAAMPEPTIASTQVPEVAILDAKPIEVVLPQQTIQVQLAAPEAAPIDALPAEPPRKSNHSRNAQEARVAAQQQQSAANHLKRQVKKGQPPPPLGGRRNEVAVLNPEVAAAADKLRLFMVAELKKNERKQLADELKFAYDRSASGEELAKILLKPVLGLGTARYKVIDEMILVKEALGAMESAQAHMISRSIAS